MHNALKQTNGVNMIEAKIVLPTNKNNGETLLKEHQELKKLLCTNYGGYTQISHAVGCWYDEKSNKMFEEAVINYVVAIPDTIIEKEQIKKFAIEYGKKAEQLAVYFVIGGKVSIIELD